MARDPLVILGKLRDREVQAARRVLADHQATLAEAEARAAAARQALREEAEAGDPAAYAAWLPRGLAEQAEAEATRQQAEAGLEAARQALAAARTAARAVELLEEKRAREAREEEERRATRSNEEWAAHRHAARGKDQGPDGSRACGSRPDAAAARRSSDG
jgi:flagellar biosynthesis chaperone FliJ